MASTQSEDKRKYDRHLKDSLGPMKLVDIKQDHVELVLESLSDKTASANRLFALQSTVLHEALVKTIPESSQRQKENWTAII